MTESPKKLHFNFFFAEINVSRLKAISSLTEVNLQDNPLSDEVHHQLLEITVISVLLTPRDPELDGVD